MNQTENYNLYYVEPEESTFHSIVVDLTHKCNMECANCYIPNRDIDDMNVEKLLETISKLPQRTEIRLMGGEPTMVKRLPEIIKSIRAAGHRPTMLTNGLKLGNAEYAKSLYDAGLRSLNISMNGGDDDDVYEITDNVKCAERKVAALENCLNLGMFININCIIAKGVNEHVIDWLLNKFDGLNKSAVLRFRNIGELGRHDTSNGNYTYDELIQLVTEKTGKSVEWAKQWNNVEGFEEKYNLLYPLDETRKRRTVWIKLTDWNPSDSDIPDPNSKRRGRITQDFKIAPFFEHVKENEFGY